VFINREDAETMYHCFMTVMDGVGCCLNSQSAYAARRPVSSLHNKNMHISLLFAEADTFLSTSFIDIIHRSLIFNDYLGSDIFSAYFI
jgi:hypothetical protein